MTNEELLLQYCRQKPVDVVVNEWMNLYIDMPMKDWENPLDNADIGQLFLSMCGFFSTTMTLVIDNDHVVDLIANELITVFKV